MTIIQKGEPMSDLISRQAAIDAIRASTSKYTGFMEMEMYTDDDAVEAIEALPPAQPSSSRSHENDLISRWAVIRAVDKHTREDGTLDDDISCILEDLPPAQPERKRGRWNITDAYPHNVYCSECYTRFAQTHWAVWEDGSLPRNFCPNCGADMRGKQDDSF